MSDVRACGNCGHPDCTDCFPPRRVSGIIRQTRTYVTLEVPPLFWQFVKRKLEEAGYNHAIMEDGEIDMHGIALTPNQGIPEPRTDLTHIGETKRGYQVFVEDNTVGGHTYWSDEVGNGVVVWDTSLVSKETLQLALNLEDTRHAEVSEQGSIAPKL
jgi:hypothetical protein